MLYSPSTIVVIAVEGVRSMLSLPLLQNPQTPTPVSAIAKVIAAYGFIGPGLAFEKIWHEPFVFVANGKGGLELDKESAERLKVMLRALDSELSKIAFEQLVASKCFTACFMAHVVQTNSDGSKTALYPGELFWTDHHLAYFINSFKQYLKTKFSKGVFTSPLLMNNQVNVSKDTNVTSKSRISGVVYFDLVNKCNDILINETFDYIWEDGMRTFTISSQEKLDSVVETLKKAIHDNQHAEIIGGGFSIDLWNTEPHGGSVATAAFVYDMKGLKKFVDYLKNRLPYYHVPDFQDLNENKSLSLCTSFSQYLQQGANELRAYFEGKEANNNIMQAKQPDSQSVLSLVPNNAKVSDFKSKVDSPQLKTKLLI